jgi:putative tributyrin esterase
MFVQMNVRSQVLDSDQGVYVLLPEPRIMQIYEKKQVVDKPLPVLYLLHGYHGGHTAWLRRTAVEFYLRDSEKHMIIIMPTMHNYFYTDMKIGRKYFTYLTEELPRMMKSYYHISDEREKTFVAGFSMGGYGAFKWALNYPERFAMAASFSGDLDVFNQEHEASIVREFEFIFGEDRHGTNSDLMHLLEENKKQGKKMPKLYQSVGTDDFLYENNLRFRDKAQALGYDLDYYEEPGVGHDWPFWDREVKKIIDMIPADTLSGTK